MCSSSHQQAVHALERADVVGDHIQQRLGIDVVNVEALKSLRAAHAEGAQVSAAMYIASTNHLYAACTNQKSIKIFICTRAAAALTNLQRNLSKHSKQQQQQQQQQHRAPRAQLQPAAAL
jgi:hypothetical protein